MEAKRVFSLILFYLGFSSYFCSRFLTKQIKLQQGKLRGLTNLSNTYEAYLGIPYASVGERYQEAGKPPSWNGIFIASHGNIQCYQYSSTKQKPVGQNDCLVVNIFKPKCIINNNLIPVMIFIPGGGFYSGSNSFNTYDPKYFVDKGVMVVTINYRVGAFGYLCLNGTDASGNIGLKDQLLAIRWVKDNIQAFGGDSNSITVFGTSAGSASLHFIILTKNSKNIFNKAIFLSGTSLQSTLFDNDPLKTASFVASRMGYNTTDPQELLAIFRNSTTDKIINATHIDPTNNSLKQYLFRPCVEIPGQGKSPIITATPRKLLKEFKNEPNLKIIMGFNNKEGILWAANYNESGLVDLNQNFNQIIPENIIFNNTRQKTRIANEVKEYYFDGGAVNNTGDGLIDFFTDTVIAYPETVSYKNFLKNNVTVYNYYFEIDSNRNVYKFQTPLPYKRGASHGDILGYEFNSDKTANITLNETDIFAINIITRLFTNFAKTGKPTANGVNWIPSKLDNIQFLDITNNGVAMIPMPIQDRMNLWARIYNTYDAY